MVRVLRLDAAGKEFTERIVAERFAIRPHGLSKDLPTISAALTKLNKSGQVVIQVMTRMEGLGLPYVGIDNQAAGRMAGLLLSGLQRKTGSVVALCHSQIYGVHRDRIKGFSDFMQRPEASHLKFVQAAFTQDEVQELSNVASFLLRQTPDLVGIYGAGGDYGPLCELLKRSQREHDVCLIGHELTAQSEMALRDGTMAAVIDQAPETQARRALDLALQMLGLLRTQIDATPIRFITITAQNL